MSNKLQSIDLRDDNSLSPFVLESKVPIIGSNESISLINETQKAVKSNSFDSDNFISNYLHNYKGLINEGWERTTLISAKILSIKEEAIECDCIYSLSDSITETRAFSKNLFGLLCDEMYIGKPVKIKFSEKPGALKVEVIKGENLGVLEEFESLHKWSSIEGLEKKKLDGKGNL